MNVTKLLSILLSFCLFSCTTVSNYQKQESFEKQVKDYKQTIRWLELEDALSFQDAENRQTPESIEAYRGVRLTSYDVKKMVVSEDNLHVYQTVEIKYYREDSAVEKTVIDHQLWEYNENLEKWFLKSVLPPFK